MKITVKSPLLNLMGLAPTGDLGPLTGYTTKAGTPVWYLKAPPKTPATNPQLAQRHMFRLIAVLWRRLGPQKRADWQLAATRAHLKITGLNLFTWYQHRQDRAVIRTVEHLSNISLLD